jgi:glycosyltransferase involved in cell wall biosynthesis
MTNSAFPLTLLNVYRKDTGVSNVALCYYNAIKARGTSIRWLQLVEGRLPSDYPAGEEVVRGLPLPITPLRVFLNRYWKLRSALPRLGSTRFLVADPTPAFAISKPERAAVVVHDLRPLTEFGSIASERFLYRVLSRRLRSFGLVLADSNSTRDELLKVGIRPDRIRVVYPYPATANGELRLGISTRAGPSNRPRTIFCIANDLPYKNVATFLRVAQKCATVPRMTRLKFTLIASGLRTQTRRLISKMGLDNLEVLERVESLSNVYESGDVLMLPSLYEGFGMPVIEAMKQGIPVVVSDLPVMHEVVGSAGLFVGGTGLDGWCDAIGGLLDDGSYADYSDRAVGRSKLFTKETFGQSVREVIEFLGEGS